MGSIVSGSWENYRIWVNMYKRIAYLFLNKIMKIINFLLKFFQFHGNWEFTVFIWNLSHLYIKRKTQCFHLGAQQSKNFLMPSFTEEGNRTNFYDVVVFYMKNYDG
jgi:hypothetical protein